MPLALLIDQTFWYGFIKFLLLMKLGKNESFKSQMKFAFKLEMCLDTSHKL